MKQGKAPIDLERAVCEFDADREFLKELLDGFLDNVRKQIEIIQRALEEGNSEAVRREAHSIKGGAANICADRMARMAFALERAGKSGTLDKGREMLAELQNEFICLADYARDEL
jgi:HPt (histidine-containing phosphotransfer) domain-containing protein